MSQCRYNIKLIIAYDGTKFLGWQKTEEGKSVQEELQRVLETMLQASVKLQAASRTDAGVHARGQVVNFYSNKDLGNLDRWQHRINLLLPSSVVTKSVEYAPINFHPTLDCTGKEYHYDVCYGKIQHPDRRLYSWHYWYPIHIESMRMAAKHLIGKHDFKAFCNMHQGTAYESTIREIFSFEIHELPEQRLRFIVKGSNFLYKMVRNLIGTLLFVGRGKITVDQVPFLLKAGARKEIGITAAAHGLTLYQVQY